MLRPLCVCWAYASGTDAQAEYTRKALVRMLSIRVRNWCVCSAYASVFPFFKRPFVTEVPTQTMLSIRVRNCCACWAYAPGTDAHADQWAYANVSVPYAYAEHARQKLYGVKSGKSERSNISHLGTFKEDPWVFPQYFEWSFRTRSQSSRAQLLRNLVFLSLCYYT